MVKKRQIDHIVLTVSDLQNTMNLFQNTYGIQTQHGGQHKEFGTHNALVNLGNGVYLEILAPDPNNEAFAGKRWMGADLSQNPVVSRWALKSSDLENDQSILSKFNKKYGDIIEGSRQKTDGNMLRWKMIKPLPSPLVDIVPFMVDWTDSDSHPTDSLPVACQLHSIEFGHPEKEKYQQLFEELNVEHKVEVATDVHIRIRLQTDKGIVEL